MSQRMRRAFRDPGSPAAMRAEGKEHRRRAGVLLAKAAHLEVTAELVPALRAAMDAGDSATARELTEAIADPLHHPRGKATRAYELHLLSSGRFILALAGEFGDEHDHAAARRAMAHVSKVAMPEVHA